MQKIFFSFLLLSIVFEVTTASQTIDSREIKIATVHWLSDSLTTKEQNLQRAILFIHQAARKKVDVILFPENVLASGVVPTPATLLAEPVTGNSLDIIRQVATRNQLYVIFPFLEVAAKKIFNSAVIIDRNGGVAGIYRQTHPFLAMEPNKEISSGDLFPVFELDFARIGIQIGADISFPEAGAILALSGAEIIFLPHQFQFTDDLNWRLIFRNRALDNDVYLVTSGKSEKNEQLSEGHMGTTVVINSRGEVEADQLSTPGILFHTIKMHRSGKKNSIWKANRRPEIYQKLIENSVTE
ncbi:carbon-nitrogen hydrolase family protein [candidate division KSB1 bacterium]|nr:carbon-nitrogen hydrolase family protein [candidate division KSB1 bacterium]